MNRRCTGCGVEKPLHQYYPGRTVCNPCIVEKQRNDRAYKKKQMSVVSEWLAKWDVPTGWREWRR